MTGTVDSSTTLRIRPAPPRGMSTSTSPRARISALTLSWVSPGTSWMTSGSKSGHFDRLAQRGHDRLVARSSTGTPPQQHGVARLQADPGGIRGHVRPRLIDHADDPERHSNLTHLQTVGEYAAAHDLADRVRQSGDVAQTLSHRVQSVLGQPQAIDDVGRRAGRLGASDVLGVGDQNRGGVLDAARPPWRAARRSLVARVASARP